MNQLENDETGGGDIVKQLSNEVSSTFWNSRVFLSHLL